MTIVTLALIRSTYINMKHEFKQTVIQGEVLCSAAKAYKTANQYNL